MRWFRIYILSEWRLFTITIISRICDKKTWHKQFLNKTLPLNTFGHFPPSSCDHVNVNMGNKLPLRQVTIATNGMLPNQFSLGLSPCQDSCHADFLLSRPFQKCQQGLSGCQFGIFIQFQTTVATSGQIFLRESSSPECLEKIRAVSKRCSI